MRCCFITRRIRAKDRVIGANGKATIGGAANGGVVGKKGLGKKRRPWKKEIVENLRSNKK